MNIFDPILNFVDGKKTYLSGAGLLGLAVYQATQKEYITAWASLMAALAAFGVRHALAKVQGQSSAPKENSNGGPPVLPLVLTAFFLAGSAQAAAPSTTAIYRPTTTAGAQRTSL